jgi:hypothetical protein
MGSCCEKKSESVLFYNPGRKRTIANFRIDEILLLKNQEASKKTLSGNQLRFLSFEVGQFN